MSDRFMDEVRAFAAAAGLELSTLGQMALRNPRYFDRRARREEMDADAERRLRAFMTSYHAERDQIGDVVSEPCPDVTAPPSISQGGAG